MIMNIIIKHYHIYFILYNNNTNYIIQLLNIDIE